MSGWCLGSAWEVPGKCLGSAWEVPGKCLGPARRRPGPFERRGSLASPHSSAGESRGAERAATPVSCPLVDSDSAHLSRCNLLRSLRGGGWDPQPTPEPEPAQVRAAAMHDLKAVHRCKEAGGRAHPTATGPNPHWVRDSGGYGTRRGQCSPSPSARRSRSSAPTLSRRPPHSSPTAPPHLPRVPPPSPCASAWTKGRSVLRAP